MSTNSKPLAHRLADALDAWDGVMMMPKGWREQAAAELRRLQAANEEQTRANATLVMENKELIRTNINLISALTNLADYASNFSVSCVYLSDEVEGKRLLEAAYEAIDKNTEETEYPLGDILQQLQEVEKERDELKDEVVRLRDSLMRSFIGASSAASR